ncbi:MAG: hypothetical protein ACLS4Z_00605 [Christensenellaceae bacterium]
MTDQTCSFYTGQRLLEAELLWNVNTCLAYGAKGIQYFCGVNPMGNFTGSILTAGNRRRCMTLSSRRAR